MKRTKIIFAAFIYMTLASSVKAQYFSDIQQYSTPILLNPSFVGSTRGDRLFASLQTSHVDNTKAYLKFISHDFYIKKKSLGLGYIGGVISESGQNLYSPFLSIAASKYIPQKNKKSIIPSLAIGFEQPLKDYNIFYYDAIARKGSALPPGETLARMTVLTGRIGFLFSDYNGSVGLSIKGMRSFAKTYNYYSDASYEVNTYHMLVHAEKIFTYYKRGLLSQKYLIRPRVVLQMGKDYNQLFGELTVKHNRFEIGLGYLPNFTTHNARASLNLGYDFKHFRVNYLGSVKDEDGNLTKMMHNITLSVIFPELGHFGIPVPAVIRNL